MTLLHRPSTPVSRRRSLLLRNLALAGLFVALSGCDYLYELQIDIAIDDAIDELTQFNELFAPFSQPPIPPERVACQDAEGDPRPAGSPCVVGVFPGVCVEVDPVRDQRFTTECQPLPIVFIPPGQGPTSPPPQPTPAPTPQDACQGTGVDTNQDGVCDACESTGAGQDMNSDGTCDACERAGGGSDGNGDGQCDACEIAGSGQDVNGDGTCDPCEALGPNAATVDNDNDQVPDCQDVCPLGPNTADQDLDMIPDACDNEIVVLDPGHGANPFANGKCSLPGDDRACGADADCDDLLFPQPRVCNILLRSSAPPLPDFTFDRALVFPFLNRPPLASDPSVSIVEDMLSVDIVQAALGPIISSFIVPIPTRTSQAFQPEICSGATTQGACLARRVALANQTNAIAFVSVHTNGGINRTVNGVTEVDPTQNGVETLICTQNKPPSVVARSMRLANLVQNQILAAFPQLRNRGIRERCDVAVLRLADVPAVLVEATHHSNTSPGPNQAGQVVEGQLLSTPAFRISIGEAIGRAVSAYRQTL